MKKRNKSLALLVLSGCVMALAGCNGDDNGKTSNGGNGGNNNNTVTPCRTHTYADEPTEILAQVSSTSDGKARYTCTVCGKTKDLTVHNYGAWQTTVEPTETTDGKKIRKCTNCSAQGEEAISKIGFPYNVKIKDANGNVISNEIIRSVNKIEKPADPTAPAGKVFYGWKNVKNGGQIWNFDDDTLGLVADDVELEPAFVDAGINPQYLEAEFAPAITAGSGMHGCTYSGGADGRQMIDPDKDYALGSTCEQGEFKYYRDSSNKLVIGENPNGSTNTLNPKGEKTGYFVHFNYNNGNELVWNIESDKDVDDVTVFARFSSEYGKDDAEKADKYNRFNDEQFKITVNGTRLEYGTITMHNVPIIGKFLPFQDYMVGVNVSLKQGANVITMKVDNEDGYSGTLPSASPCIDNIKLYTSAAITWNEADLTNIIK